MSRISARLQVEKGQLAQLQQRLVQRLVDDFESWL